MATGIHSVSAETGFEITPVTSGVEMKWNGTTGEFYAISRPAGTYSPITARGAWSFASTLTVASTVTLTSMNVAGFVKNDANGVLSGGNTAGSGGGLIDISTDTNLAVTAPVLLTGDTIGFDYNTTNLKLTSSKLNTIQDIATSSSPTFVDLTLTDDLDVAGDLLQTGTGTTTFRNDAGSKVVNIQGDTNTSTLNIIGYRAASTPIAGQLNFEGARGTLSSPLIVPASSIIGRVRGLGWDGSSAFLNSCSIDLYTGVGTPSTTSMPGRISFLTCPDGSTTLTEAMRIDASQDVTIFNQILGSVDVDSFLDLNGTSGTVKLASAHDMVIDIDYDNNSTGRSFKIRHNNATDLFEVQDDGDVIIPLGDLYVADAVSSNTLSSNLLDLTYTSNGVLLSSENLVYVLIGNGTGTGEFRVNNNAGDIVIQGLQNGDVKVPSGDLYLSNQLCSTLNSNIIDLATGGSSTTVLVRAYHDIYLDIDYDNAGGGDFFVSKNGLGTNLFKVANAGNVSALAGDLTVETAGKGLKVKEGSNARMGTATLVGGTVTVSNTSITASTRIFYNRITTGGTVGHLRIASRSVGTNFVITSSSGTETSSVDWFLVEPA